MFLSNITKLPHSTLISMLMVGVVLLLGIASAHAEQAILTWDANTEPYLGGYKVYYGTVSKNYASNIDVGKQTSYTVSGLQGGVTYYFAVTAYDTSYSLESGYSNEVSKQFPSPSGLTADFTASPTSGTVPLLVSFTDTSTGNVTDWSWDFGDGTTSTGKIPLKTYSKGGTYTVGLTVTGPTGSATTTKTDYISVVWPAPLANFNATPTSGTAPLTVNFSDTSTGEISSWYWDFGDGSSSTAQNPTHTYSSMDSYTVRLTATGPGGSNSTTKTNLITVSSQSGGGGIPELVAAYSFNEISGPTAVDASGNGNHGVISGPTRVTKGRFDKALAFDGVNDWVTVNDAPSLDLSTGMTLGTWVYPTVDMTEWRVPLMKEQPNGAVYYVAANTDQNQPATAVTIGGEQILYGGPWLPANSWTHLAATYNGTVQRLYVNGQQVAEQAQTGVIKVSSGVLRIGGNSIWGEYFPGRIDEIRIYNQALTAAQIQADMNAAVATSSPEKVLVGDKKVWSLTDSSPQGTAEAFRTTASASGMVTKLSIYVDGTSTAKKLVAGIYTDNGGYPGTLLAQGTLSAPAADKWNDIGLKPQSVTSGGAYWIAILGRNGVLRFRDGRSSTGELSETSAQTSLTTLPSTWVTGSVHNQGPVSAYGSGY